MKLIKKHISKDGTGSVTLVPENDEDLWHLYNLVSVNDVLRAPAIRKVHTETETGSVTSRRVHMMLSVRVAKTYFASGSLSEDGQPMTKAQSAEMQISGPIVEENEHVQVGSYHTLDITCGTKFDIIRNGEQVQDEQVKLWDSIDLDRLQEACTQGKDADLAAVIIGDSSALVCLLTDHMTIVRQRIEGSLSKKLGSAAEKAQERFFSTVLLAIVTHFGPMMSSLKTIMLAGPGFAKENLYNYIFDQVAKDTKKYPELHTGKGKFFKVHTSTAHIHALQEALKDPKISAKLTTNKFAREQSKLNEFRKLMEKDPLRAWYGPDEVNIANDRGAIATLMILDSLFRSADVATRQKYATLIEDVKAKRGEVLIFSSLNASGMELKYLTGVAAILTYPIDIEAIQDELKAGS